MKKMYIRLLTASFALGAMFTANAQVNNVGIGTKSPDQSAVLDIQSADKGLLIPRMTAEQRNAITQPADGLMIYQIGEKSGFYFFEKNTWKPISDTEAKSVAGVDGDWTLTGNVGTNPATDFMGTIDAKDLILKANNNERVRIGANSGIMTIRDNISSYGTLQFSTFSDDYRIEGGANAGVMTIKSPQLKILTNSIERLRVVGNGNVGINTTLPSEKLHVVGNIYSPNIITAGQYLRTNFYRALNNNLLFSYGNVPNEVRLGSGDPADYTAIYSGAVERIRVFKDGETRFGGSVKVQTVTGHLAVGDFAGTGLTTPTGYRLIVQDGILTEKVKVALKTTGDWADYVFEPHYKLMSLEEVESFTKENKHLPNVPSADEMINSGLDVAQTSKMFMEKIEELTLYMIELNKEVKSLKAENEELKAKLK